MSEPAKKKGFFSRLFAHDAPPQPNPEAEASAQSEADNSQAPDLELQEQPQAEDALAIDSPGTSDVPGAIDVSTSPRPAADIEKDTPHNRPATPADPDQHDAPAEKKTSWLTRLKAGLTKTSSKLSDGISGLFTKRKLTPDTLDDLEDLLIQSDLGVETSMRITTALSQGRYQKGLSADDVRQVLAAEVERVLQPVAQPLRISSANKPHVILMVGVNGTGKTTTIGKLAQKFAGEGRKVMMAAGDTFRAAAIDQLQVWGKRSGATVVTRAVGADSSGLAFDALKEAQAGGYDVLLIDTAGRLQNKQALMDELEKVVRVLKKIDPDAPHDVLLVLDATTGQNAMQQVEVFRQRAGVTGLILTKLDGTARGGIIVAIAQKFGLPVHAIGVGEGIEDLQPFAADAFARAIADIG